MRTDHTGTIAIGRSSRRALLNGATVLAALLLAIGARDAHAQGLGYAVAGPAGYSGFFGASLSAFQAAAGGELLVAGRAGATGEFGVLGNASGGLIVWSIGGVVHLMSARGRVSPFVTSGYTRLSNGEGTFDAWNAGAGLDAWNRERFGVRVEIRDQVRPDRRGDVHYWTLRAGVVFR